MHRSAVREDPSDNPRAVAGDNSRKRDVKRTAEELRAKFLRDYAGAGAPYRPRLLAAAAISDLSDGAFRVLAVRSIYANADGTSCTASQDTIATLLGRSRRMIERFDNELKGWQEGKEDCKQPKNRFGFLSIKQRHPNQKSALVTLVCDADLSRIVAELSRLDPSNLSGLNFQDPTDLTGLTEQMCSDPTDSAFRPDIYVGQPCSSYPEEKEDSLSETPFSEGERDADLFANGRASDATKKAKARRPTYTPEFETFWKAVPRHQNATKSEAFAEWLALSDEDRQLAQQAIPQYEAQIQRDARTKGRRYDEQLNFIKHTCRWLKFRGWESALEQGEAHISTPDLSHLPEHVRRLRLAELAEEGS